MKKMLLVLCVLVSLLPVATWQSLAQTDQPYHIVFVSHRTGNDDIFVMNQDGSNVINLTDAPSRDWHPDWSPDGQKIVFTSDRTDNKNPDIFVINNNGTEVRNLTHDNANDNSPDWSPDNNQIVFGSDRDGGQDLYVVRVNTGEVTRLTNDGITKSAPAWSPDGKQIAYWMTDSAGVPQIYMVDLATNQSKALTTEGPNNWPTWSFDGTRLVFENSSSAANANLEMLSLADNKITPITTGSANNVRPAWTTNGDILFASDRDGGNIDIYQTSLDSSHVQRLTSSSGEDSAPAWQPIPVPIKPRQGGASVQQNFTVLTGNNVGGTSEIGNGTASIFAPHQVGLDDLIRVRLEVKADIATNLPTATPSLNNGSTPTPLPEIERQNTNVYSIMGAELRGADINRFTSDPSPSDYVLRLQPDGLNFWEWTLRANGPDALGKRYFSAVLYIPTLEKDGSITKTVTNRFDFSMQVLQQSPIDMPTPQPPGPPRFSVVYDQDESFSLITLSDIDLSQATITASGGVFGLFTLSTDFSATQSLKWQPGICLIYSKDGSKAVRPRQCNQIFVLPLSRGDIFWYDFGHNLLRDTIIRYQDQALICSSAEVRCDF